jgi:hypothetical protein
MSDDASTLVELLDQLIRFDFSDFSVIDDDDEYTGPIIASRINKDIREINLKINSVIENIQKNNFVGFRQEDVVIYKQKLSLIEGLLDRPELSIGYNKYIDLGLENEQRADVRNFWYSEEKLRIFIKKLEKHLGSAARSQKPPTSPLLDEVLEEIGKGNSLDIVVNGQALNLSSGDLTTYLGSLEKIFTCPISLEIMNDPVICSDGQTYDRKAIEEWFELGHNTSPITNVRLANRNLMPNYPLKQAIDAYKVLRNAKKVGAGYKRRKTKTGRKSSKYTRRSKKNKK